MEEMCNYIKEGQKDYADLVSRFGHEAYEMLDILQQSGFVIRSIRYYECVKPFTK